MSAELGQRGSPSFVGGWRKLRPDESAHTDKQQQVAVSRVCCLPVASNVEDRFLALRSTPSA